MDKVGEYTLKIMKEAGWYNDWLFSLITNHLGGEILEVGAGIGNFTKLLKRKGKVTAIDYDVHYINKLKSIFKDVSVGFGDIEKGTYFFGNEKKFDTVVCMNVLEHIEGDLKALKNMQQLLKKLGKLLLLVPAHKIAYGTLDKQLGHMRRYSKIDLRNKLHKVGFKIESMRYVNLLGIWGWFLNSKVFKKKILPDNQLKLFDIFSRPYLSIEKYIEPPFGLSILVVAKK